MRFENLKNSLKTKPQPCYYLVGQDDFLISSAIDMLKQLAGGIQEFSVSFLDAPNANRVVDDCMQIPLMGGTRVVFVRGLVLQSKDSEKGDKKRLREYLASPNEGCILVFIQPNDSVIKTISAYAICVECDKVSTDIMLKYIMREVSKANRKISEENALKLIEMCGNMSYLSLELKKLCYYGADFDEITLDVMHDLIEPMLEYKIFELSDAIYNRDMAKAIQIYDKLLSQRTEPTTILGMLYKSFRRIFYALSSDLSDAEIATALDVKPYAITMSKKQSKNYTVAQLRKILSMLNQCEFDIKSGRLNSVTGVKNAILNLF